MKTFIPKGDNFIVTAASFIAPESESGFTANQRYDLERCNADIDGNVVYGFSEDDDGIETYIANDRLGPFSELVVFQVRDSYDNHRAQKKALRFRHMLIRAFVKLANRYGWCDTKKWPTCFIINRKRGGKYVTHTIKDWARQMAAHYFNADGLLDRQSFMIDIPDHEINQEFFDELAYEYLTNW